MPIAESEPIVAALIEHGIPYDYLVLPGGGHGFFAASTELAVRARIEASLAVHLGNRLVP